MAIKIYDGKYYNSSDQIYLVSNGKIYKGKYDNSSDELKGISYQALLNKDGKIYKENTIILQTKLH